MAVCICHVRQHKLCAQHHLLHGRRRAMPVCVKAHCHLQRVRHIGRAAAAHCARKGPGQVVLRFAVHLHRRVQPARPVV